MFEKRPDQTQALRNREGMEEIKKADEHPPFLFLPCENPNPDQPESKLESEILLFGPGQESVF